MVSTRSALANSQSDDSNRVVAIVTGANSGVGYGLCQRLLDIYSQPPGHVIKEGLPQPTALIKSIHDNGAREVITTGANLTLILAVRKRQNGEQAKKELLDELKIKLAKRSRIDGNDMKAWRQQLRIEVEEVDFDTPYGEKGVLAFTERIKARHPHVTSLYINAGLLAAIAIKYVGMTFELFRVGPFRTFAYPDVFMSEDQGRLSADGERGGVWTVNVFAPYILTRELLSHLQKSPTSLPTPPRVVYTSSSSSGIDSFDNLDLADAQMISYAKTYGTSKYAGDCIITELDRTIADSSGKSSPNQSDASLDKVDGTEDSPRRVRCLIAEPAIVMTNVARQSWRDYSFLTPILAFFQGLVFLLCRALGSPYHVRDAQDAATGLLYASLVPEKYLPKAQDPARRKFGLIAHPFSEATVQIKEVDGWDSERGEQVVNEQVKACEVLWKQARRREGLE